MMMLPFDKETLDSYLESLRPPPDIRPELDINYEWDDTTLSLFLCEVRPRWDKPDEIMSRPFAKMKFTKSKKIWKLYWMRGNGKWLLYEPYPEDGNLYSLLQVVNEDKMHCFKG